MAYADVEVYTKPVLVDSPVQDVIRIRVGPVALFLHAETGEAAQVRDDLSREIIRSMEAALAAGRGA